MPSIPDTIVPREWILAGPFPVGTREGITGVIEDPATFRPFEGESLRSSLVQGGIVVCRKTKIDSTGWLATDYKDVRWDSIQDYYGIAGLVSMGYAYAEFEVPHPCRALALTPQLGGFYLNGLSFPADAYGNGWLQVPVVLDSGINRVMMSISGYGDERVKFTLVPSPTPILIARDFTLPDLVENEPLSTWFGIPVVNTTPERADDLSLTISSLSGAMLGDATIGNLPGLGAKKVPVSVVLPVTDYDTSGFRLCACVLRHDAVICRETLRLNIRHPEEACKVTFISGIDGSCQYYAIMYPKPYDPAKKYSLIFSTHGAGVEAIGQAQSYKPKDWAFVVAATNRRPYGFNWQDWGRLDGLEVLGQVIINLPIDPDRVLLTGHSMGGHGAWHIATVNPDQFAAAAPEAGWPSIQLYIPWFQQRSINFAEPAQLAIRDQVLRMDNVPAMLVNLLNLPAFIVHGGDDDNVPTLHGRSFAEWLKELGYRYTYKEVPGRKHWWSYEKETLSVLDDPDLMAFLKQQKRDPLPPHIHFRTADLGTSNRNFWVTIDRVRTVGRDAEIEAWASDTLVRVNTTNIDQFSLELTDEQFFSVAATVEADGGRLAQRVPPPAHLTLHHDAKGWSFGPFPQPTTRNVQLAIHKAPALYGPAKQVMMSPFLLVYGTGDTGIVRYLRHAATQEAVRWWVNGNGYTEVLPDTEVTDEMWARYNLLLYGGGDVNSVTRQIAAKLPIQVKEGRMYADKTLLGPDLAAIVTYPNPLAPNHLVLVRMGTDAENTRLSLFYGIAGPSTGVPDFMVFDKSVRRYGWAGVRAAGFFDPDWNLAPASMYIRP